VTRACSTWAWPSPRSAPWATARTLPCRSLTCCSWPSARPAGGGPPQPRWSSGRLGQRLHFRGFRDVARADRRTQSEGARTGPAWRPGSPLTPCSASSPWPAWCYSDVRAATGRHRRPGQRADGRCFCGAYLSCTAAATRILAGRGPAALPSRCWRCSRSWRSAAAGPAGRRPRPAFAGYPSAVAGRARRTVTSSLPRSNPACTVRRPSRSSSRKASRCC